MRELKLILNGIHILLKSYITNLTKHPKKFSLSAISLILYLLVIKSLPSSNLCYLLGFFSLIFFFLLLYAYLSLKHIKQLFPQLMPEFFVYTSHLYLSRTFITILLFKLLKINLGLTLLFPFLLKNFQPLILGIVLLTLYIVAPLSIFIIYSLIIKSELSQLALLKPTLQKNHNTEFKSQILIIKNSFKHLHEKFYQQIYDSLIRVLNLKKERLILIIYFFLNTLYELRLTLKIILSALIIFILSLATIFILKEKANEILIFLPAGFITYSISYFFFDSAKNVLSIANPKKAEKNIKKLVPSFLIYNFTLILIFSSIFKGVLSFFLKNPINYSATIIFPILFLSISTTFWGIKLRTNSKTNDFFDAMFDHIPFMGYTFLCIVPSIIINKIINSSFSLGFALFFILSTLVYLLGWKGVNSCLK